MQPSSSFAAILAALATPRNGSVLDNTTILKVDNYLQKNNSSSKTWFPRKVSGADRLRLIDGTCIAGVSQPTVPGVRSILDFLGTGRSLVLPSTKRSVLWINLREEPLLYLNGRAVVLRHRDEPFRNMATFKGISEKRLVDLEWRLKEDVVEEARRCGGSIIVHSEQEYSVLDEQWESAPPSAVMTAEEVFFQFRQEGYRVRYKRIPCTSNHPPALGFFDELLQAINSIVDDRDTWIVFNCQSGMVRSTLAMVAASCIQRHRGMDISFSPSAAPVEEVANEDETERQLLAGWYTPVLQMIRLLVGGGREAKSQVDAAIDMFSHTNNLRREIFALRTKAANIRNPALAKLALVKASVALQRYMMLILFQAYLQQDEQRSTHSGGGFSRWMDERKEIRALLKSLETELSTALEAAAPSSPLYPLVRVSSSNNEEHQQERIRSTLASRKGSMLNTDMIIKWDTAASQTSSHNFRQVAGMRVFGLSTCNTADMQLVLKKVQQTDDTIKSVLFCNLREEPFVYINGKPFVLRSVLKPFKNTASFQDIDSSRLELAEEQMKLEILQEARANMSQVVVHNEDVVGSLKVGFEQVDEEEEVQTPREVFERFASQEGLPVKYKRIPMTPESEPSLTDIDEIIQLVRRYKQQSNTAFVFFCQQGRGRSTIATIIASLELDSMVPSSLDDESESLKCIRSSRVPKMMSLLSDVVERTNALTPQPTSSTPPLPQQNSSSQEDSTESMQELRPPTPHPHAAAAAKAANGFIHTHTDFPALLSLCRVIPQGPTAKLWLDHTIDDCGQIYNLRKSALEHAIEARSGADSVSRSEALLQIALAELRMYFVLLEVAGYCLEHKEQQRNGNMRQILFREWALKRPELATLKEDIRDESALVLMHPETPTNTGVVHARLNRFVQERRGSVMVKGSILKTDHFPGCRRLPNPQVEIPGAPNFRSVWPEGMVDGIDLRAYGTGIPTRDGLVDSLELLQAHKPGDVHVTWVNLREEPILYCNGRPFVLRRLEEPFANLEHTGISRNRVEDMEMRMKQDVELEAKQNPTHSILIHEEDDNGELLPKWEVLETIQTPKELFEECSKTYNLAYWRVPITDEQSPKLTAIDTILEIVNQVPSSSHLVFNCQMGRGRTTTGLVVACAVRLRKLNATRRFVQVVDESIAPKRKFRSRIRMQGNQLEENVHDELSGNYQAITAQVRMMENGVEAKSVMDALIDVCDAMQNLREAVHDVKLRSNQHDLSPVLRKEALHVAEHYLRRYSLLIQFSGFLFTINLGKLKFTMAPKFSQWLKSRPELLNAWKSLSAGELKGKPLET